MTCEERKALGVIAEQHCSEVAVTETNLAVLSNRAVDTEALETDTDVFGSFLSVLCACLKSDSSAYTVSPAYVFEADGLNALSDFIGVKTCSLADLTALLYRRDTVLSQKAVDLSASSVVVFT